MASKTIKIEIPVEVRGQHFLWHFRRCKESVKDGKGNAEDGKAVETARLQDGRIHAEKRTWDRKGA